MQWLAALCVRQPVLTWVLMLAVVVFGLVGYGSLGVDFFPNIDIPVVLVTTTLNGTAPEEVETSLTDKIEGAVNTIGGIDELRSTSSEGVSLVIVSFALDKNIDVAVQEVRDHVTTVLPQLPKGLDPPIVSKLDPDAAPILLVTVSGRAAAETSRSSPTSMSGARSRASAASGRRRSSAARSAR